MTYVGSAGGGASSITLPTHAAGDLLTVFAINSDSTTIPSVPSGWTSRASGSGSSRAWRIGTRVASAPGTTSGTWTNATDTSARVDRDVTPGAAAGMANGVPGLTLTGAPSIVATFESGDSPLLTGTTNRANVDGFYRIADTDGTVSSWSAQTGGRTWSIGGAIELVPTSVRISGSLLAVGRDVGGRVVGSLLSVVRSVQVQRVTGSLLAVGRQVVDRISGALLPVSRRVESFGMWHEQRYTRTWLDAVAAPDAMLRSWAELVDMQGNAAPVMVGRDLRERLPLDDARVTFRGEQAEQWSAEASYSDPWMVPDNAAHPLYGVSVLRVRFWWGVCVPGGVWMDMPVCTLAIGNSGGTDSGLISGTVRFRDVLSTVRGGYADPLDVSGLTVDEAIRAIFERVAPTLPLCVAPTSVVVPAGTVLDGRDALKDLTELAAIGWPNGRVRSDREGVIVAGPRPEPAGPVLDWQEGEGCPVSELRWARGIEHMGNQLDVASTHADAAGLWVRVSDDDPSSPTSVQQWGPHPLPVVETDKAATTEGLTNLGTMLLGKALKPVVDVSAVIPQRPDLDYEQPVQLGRGLSRVSGLHRVNSWALRLPNGHDPEPMEVGMMARYLR